jgi:hypothetical protein
MAASDDLDLPFDNNPCTQDVCTAGTASNPNVTAGNSCGTNTICDGQGACVACISPVDLPGDGQRLPPPDVHQRRLRRRQHHRRNGDQHAGDR